MKMGCILLAAGTGRRFGGNKLLSDLSGRPMIDYILGNLPLKKVSCCVGVASNRQVLAHIRERGLTAVLNDRPEDSISRSIRLGIEALDPVDACMFVVADQPLLSGETIEAMIDSYAPGTIRSLAADGRRGNPVIFPSFLLSELSALQKGEFGTKVLFDHPELLALHEIDDASQLLDVDDPQALQRVIRLLEK